MTLLPLHVSVYQQHGYTAKRKAKSITKTDWMGGDGYGLRVSMRVIMNDDMNDDMNGDINDDMNGDINDDMNGDMNDDRSLRDSSTIIRMFVCAYVHICPTLMLMMMMIV